VNRPDTSPDAWHQPGKDRRHQEADDSKTLAVVIPYYKREFVGELLDVLARQESCALTVYLFDDCSPEDPSGVIARYENRLRLRYHRFESRLGNTDLAAHWNRCLPLLGTEEWVWFLPDDDLPMDGCIESLVTALVSKPSNEIAAIRMATDIISAEGDVLARDATEGAGLEDNLEFYTRIVESRARNTLGSAVYRRRYLVEAGGFVSFPRAWGSDHATLLLVTAGRKIYRLGDARLGFRMGDNNISADRTDGALKVRARYEFVLWLMSHESIFPSKPTAQFYRSFFRKGEYYPVSEWPLEWSIWITLYRMSVLCHASWSPLPLIRLFLIKGRYWLAQ
jgi:glycosyltransferase involved in cell wall biosynthesis